MSQQARAIGVLVLMAAFPWAAHSECQDDSAALRSLTGDRALASHWIEVGMDDGKPLHLRVVEREGGLKLRFEKSGEGLWAEGSGALCAVGALFEVRFTPGRLRAGPAAGWLLRRALENGATFVLERTAEGELLVRTRVWRGRFTPAP